MAKELILESRKQNAFKFVHDKKPYYYITVQLMEKRIAL
jgi:hypothetical protein